MIWSNASIIIPAEPRSLCGRRIYFSFFGGRKTSDWLGFFFSLQFFWHFFIFILFYFIFCFETISPFLLFFWPLSCSEGCLKGSSPPSSTGVSFSSFFSFSPFSSFSIHPADPFPSDILGSLLKGFTRNSWP